MPHKQNRRLFVEEFAHHHEFDPLVPDSWYSVTCANVTSWKVSSSFIIVMFLTPWCLVPVPCTCLCLVPGMEGGFSDDVGGFSTKLRYEPAPAQQSLHLSFASERISVSEQRMTVPKSRLASQEDNEGGWMTCLAATKH